MKQFTQMDFANTIEETVGDDETDALFSQLLQRDPPATLVNDILAAVASLPLPEKAKVSTWDSKEETKMLNLLMWSC